MLVVETSCRTPRPGDGAGGVRAKPRPTARRRACRSRGRPACGPRSPFADVAEAESWLSEATEAEDTVDALVEEGIGLLNRALHAQAAASGEPKLQEMAVERAVAVRIGFGEGEEVAAGRYTAAREVDVRAAGASRRRRRAEELRPQARVAAVLGGREPVDPCETLLLRARADLDAGRASGGGAAAAGRPRGAARRAAERGRRSRPREGHGDARGAAGRGRRGRQRGSRRRAG